MSSWNKDHIGSRVIVTERSGKEKFGNVRDVIPISEQSGCHIDVNIDGSMRSHCYYPEDMVTLVPDELGDTLGEP